jgi:hypothetical protein
MQTSLLDDVEDANEAVQLQTVKSWKSFKALLADARRM